ncbi:MAG TPA: HNH endonuclease [Trebonia sp.]|nr:HNH endonuclease [Trebonia sp.]
MAVVGDVVGLCVLVFLVLAASSLIVTRTPATPSFARRAASTSTVQLRPDGNARFFTDRGFLFRRRHWFTGTCCPPVRIPAASYQQLVADQGRQPVTVAQSGNRAWWWFEGQFYWESGQYSGRDVLALIRDRERKARRRLDQAHMMLNVDEGRTDRPRGRREHIPADLKRAVFERDGGQCVQCGSNFNLQYDHVIPVALGGATSEPNLQLLCADCNRAKSASL